MSTASSAPSPRKGVRRLGDKVFSGLSTTSGVFILVALVLVAIFLFLQAWPAVTADPSEVRGGEGLVTYIGPLLFGTVLAAVIALIIAVPLSIGIALFISHYAPRKLAQALGYLVDLLAAIPSIVFGFWGLSVVGPGSKPVGTWLNEHLGWIPFFAGDASVTGKTMLVIGIVLGIMILPIMTAVNREVFLQTPRLHEEASLALGATRWEMIQQAVIPFGKSGIVSGTMLGLGRALGETMAVALILSPGLPYSIELLSDNSSSTIAADIALNLPESSGVAANTLVAAGLVLFFVTLLVNMAARWIVSRRAEFSGAN
ncbi:phosphate ABC transporter permease subunit PstC [Janibacter sp. CX7]|uniref:phosphate ABC transporter permease subunit PstC n=1 Tax=Janibacter sp. CX7 TaxID=2963431 RepID=UPI0020CD497D|nr:phosphate ABC transporter permease subunit PstC [Janibacter sp. CX7]UTT66400.1 phosphate ABC transporter permease subunit PstC [Janibacter sp. CX7]